MISILFAGDFRPSFRNKFTTPSSLFQDNLLSVLQDKDHSIVNLETPITEYHNPIIKTGCNFIVPVKNIEFIKKGLFDTVNLANNHIRDHGDEGVLDTIKHCTLNNIHTVGAGKDLESAKIPLVLNIKNKSIGILNYCEKEFNIATKNKAGANPFDLIDAYNDIISLKKKCNYTFVIYHGGVEHVHYPTPQMLKDFKFLIDIGADAIISHHTHAYSGFIQYKNKPIIFGLGDFYSETKNYKTSGEKLIGLLIRINISENDQIDVNIIPTIQNIEKQSIDLLEGSEKQRVLKQIERISNIISNKNEFENIWANYYLQEEKMTKVLLFSNNRLKYKLRKNLPFINQRISKYNLINTLNLMRCESHRNKCVSILENIYNNKYF
jgi:poly-gamma-glutamate synthesis protein (capsule biosynthesis protein)